MPGWRRIRHTHSEIAWLSSNGNILPAGIAANDIASD